MIFCSHSHPEIEFDAGTVNPEDFELSSGKTMNIKISNIIMQSKVKKLIIETLKLKVYSYCRLPIIGSSNRKSIARTRQI